VEAVAAVAHISPAHFSRSFRSVYGETPHRYLQRRRVERSMFLLRETDRTVTEVCFAVGFTSLGSREPLEWTQGYSAIGDQTSGVGARRHVQLKPIGSMDETVTTWEEGRRIDTHDEPSRSVPFKQAESSLTLEPDNDGTLATFHYRYVPRGGPLGRLTGRLIDKMLTATFTDILAAAKEAAVANG